MAKITIDTTKLARLVKKSDEIFITPQAEENIVKLLEARDQIEALIEEAQNKVAETALKLNPHFSSIQSDKIKAYYRAYGPKYYLDEAQIGLAPKELYSVESKVVYKIDSKAVEKWADEHKGMPTGIVEVAEDKRPKTLKFSLKKEK